MAHREKNPRNLQHHHDHHQDDNASADSTPLSRRQKELASTRKLLAQANHLLANVEESYIMQKEKTPRQYPTFSASEIVRGPLLGVGGFGIVWEVKDFKLKIPKEVELPAPISTLKGEETKKEGENAKTEEEDGENPTQITDEEETSSTSETQPNETQQQQQQPPPQEPSAEEDSNACPTDKIMLAIAQDDSHYDVKSARYMMAKHARRKGSSRYAIKRLHSDLNDLERTRGMIDMALEVKYLSVLWHPNIGTFKLPPVGRLALGYFLLIIALCDAHTTCDLYLPFLTR